MHRSAVLTIVICSETENTFLAFNIFFLNLNLINCFFFIIIKRYKNRICICAGEIFFFSSLPDTMRYSHKTNGIFLIFILFLVTFTRLLVWRNRRRARVLVLKLE